MGGIASALCLLLMMLTIIPIATYTMPALAGMVLIVVVIETVSYTHLRAPRDS